MFNPEKILGSMISSGMRRRGGLKSLATGGAALGLVGVAMEAVEHFMNKPRTAEGPPPNPTRAGSVPPAAPGATASPPPVPPAGSAAAAMPPPPPGALPGNGIDEKGSRQTDPVLLIRAMIAASNADGVIDAQERVRILDKLQSAGLSPEDRSFIAEELLWPRDLDTIIQAVTSPEAARQVYAVSLMAIDLDTAAERSYMNELALRLKLEPETVDNLNRKWGNAAAGVTEGR